MKGSAYCRSNDRGRRTTAGRDVVVLILGDGAAWRPSLIILRLPSLDATPIKGSLAETAWKLRSFETLTQQMNGRRGRRSLITSVFSLEGYFSSPSPRGNWKLSYWNLEVGTWNTAHRDPTYCLLNVEGARQAPPTLFCRSVCCSFAIATQPVLYFTFHASSCSRMCKCILHAFRSRVAQRQISLLTSLSIVASPTHRPPTIYFCYSSVVKMGSHSLNQSRTPVKWQPKTSSEAEFP